LPNSLFSYELIGRDPASSARLGRFNTPRGAVETPAFMPVGTAATVKGLTVEAVRATGAQIILGNTYHLALRPGDQLIQKMGGLHQFMGWDGPILTDSGGFQIFSLAEMNRVTEQAATFRSHIDGALIELSPERAIEIQEALGSDVAMVLDHVVALPNERDTILDAMDRSIRWAARCLNCATRVDQARFAIVQGGLDAELRKYCAEALAAMDFEGFAIGGLSVGEAPAEMYRIVEATSPYLPADRPRYLMGVGRPIDLLESIARGVDLFDCVMPTRNGRNALAFTDHGPLRMRNAVHRDDPRPLESDCPCWACRHSRSYLRHLFAAGEMLGPILLSHHNLTYYQRLMSRARHAIAEGTFGDLLTKHRAIWNSPAP
jgi:queuine tRNA-ribosyltransferase